MVSQVANCLRVFDLAFDHERFVDRHEDRFYKFVELVEDERLVFSGSRNRKFSVPALVIQQ